MSQFWSDLVHRLTPYVPGEQPRLERPIKLNTNENPYGPSPAAEGAIREAADDSLRRYPDPESEALKEAIARHYGRQVEEVFVGNGSDELLAHCFQALLRRSRPLLFPDISYSFYPVYCRLYDIDYRPVPLREDFLLAVEDYQQPNGGVILPNPNAPTGRALSLAEVEVLLAANREVPVVIDEAYVDFGAESAMSLIPHYSNLLVIQTLSKSRSLAGLRVGFALGHPDLIEGLRRVKDSFNSYPLSRVAMAGAVAALEDREHFQGTRHKVMATRERMAEGLTELGFEVLPSRANFLFVSHPQMAAADIAARLREREIIVRHFASGRIENWLRISVGTDPEAAALLNALRAIVPA